MSHSTHDSPQTLGEFTNIFNDAHHSALIISNLRDTANDICVQ